MAIEDPKIKLVFCGGTSLSKAFGTIERMSEDIDIKIDITPLTELTSTARKNYLSQYKVKIKSALTAAGFIEDVGMADASNSNQLFSSQWLYQSKYESVISLRPHLKIEVKTCQIICQTTNKEIGYLINKIIQRNEIITEAHCQAIEETLAEKVISFLRRLDRVSSLNEKWDPTLVRHLYDIYCITSHDPHVIQKTQHFFTQLIQNDAEAFAAQQLNFGRNPVQTLLKCLSSLQENSDLENNYHEKLLPLVFGDVKPNFEEVLDNFRNVALAILSHKNY
jgi:predicted nucleotidyltransferase component of viral defense system